MVAEPGIAALYREASESFIALARTLDDADWSVPVPCTPGWTARDLLSHVSGVPDDVVAGRVDGVATEPWTASQVERNARFGVEELLTRWSEQVEQVAVFAEAIGEPRPAYDCHTHEHDLRHALGRPANRDHVVITVATDALVASAAEAGVTVVLTGEHGGSGAGAAGAAAPAGPTVRLDRFELFRSRLGRRTRDQARRLDWTGSSDAVESALDHWFVFGPNSTPILE